MSDENKQITPRANVLSKQEKRAEALRANLMKRKAFQRGTKDEKATTSQK